MLTGKTIILGVTGGIAAYKAANLASLLKKQHADVHVIMTKNAMEFITPLTFETLTVNKCLTDTFDRNFKFEVEHVELAKKADLAIIAPATANVLSLIHILNENKQYIGGMILPGIGVSMNSLTSRTAQLPRISLDPPKRLIGKNTVECMQSGALYGNASCIDGMVDRIQEELGQEATIVATGGLAKRIIPLCRHRIELDDELLLRGLWIIYEKNK